MTLPTDPGPASAEEATYPYVWRRYQALLIDGLLLLTVIFIVPPFLQDSPAARIALLFALVLYEPLLTVIDCTLGQRLIGIRVRRADDPSRRLSLPAALVRWVVKLLLGIVSFFTMRSANRYRALHDLAAGSLVINAPRDAA